MNVYYNEIDPYCCAWLRNLIAAGHLPAGDVDERSIVDVEPSDLAGYTQAHFFAGIGGWPYALRLAGWPDDRPVWTGSCPCQDFSIIGRREGFRGNRDLWPRWLDIIRECRPDCIFGEQVDHAPEWADRMAHDLDNLSFAVGAVVIPALAIGANHERQRLYFVAYADEARRENAARGAAAEAQAVIGRPPGLVHSEALGQVRWPLKPDQSWIVDGLSGEGRAVSAFGNAIIPQVAAEFIKAAI